MQLQLTGRHVEITDSIRDYVNKRFEKLERHFDRISQAHVILNVEKGQNLAEAKVNIKGICIP